MFGRETICRVVIDARLIKSRSIPRDYTKDEMITIRERLSKVTELAKEKGITLAYENSLESVSGFSSLLENNPQMSMTLDTANFLNQEQQKHVSDAESVMNLYVQKQKMIPYVHIKSTKDHILQDTVIEDGDFDWKAFLRLYNGPICIELPAGCSFQDCRQRVAVSQNTIRELSDA
jgi:sugar phosphate isomerase/epimerase